MNAPNATLNAKLKLDQYGREVKNWVNCDPVLQINDCSRLHQLIEATRDNRTALFTDDEIEEKYFLILEKENLFSDTVSFVVEHDWARVFDGADLSSDDLDFNEFKLPFPSCAFEFRISNKNIIAGCAEGQAMVVFMECNDLWIGQVIPSKTRDFILNQVCAISIMLETKVATHEVVRAPTPLNTKREKHGKVPLRSYHVVSLNKKTRAARPESPVGETGAHKRLHFRRGHWRHFATSRTWIKWQLVGDPDLGWIDKHYKL